MKNRFLLLATTFIFATATIAFWFSYQKNINQKLDALDKNLIEIQINP